MKYLRIVTTNLDEEGDLIGKQAYEHWGEAFAVIKGGYIYIYEIDTQKKYEKFLRLSDYYDVSIYNY